VVSYVDTTDNAGRVSTLHGLPRCGRGRPIASSRVRPLAPDEDREHRARNTQFELVTAFRFCLGDDTDNAASAT